jgi:diguanylate cyclase (GGDEF)-like protein
MTPTEGAGSSTNGDVPRGGDPLRQSLVDQTLSDTDQTQSDSDHTHSDADQTGSERDQASADQDQHASDLDQATADREHESPSADDGQYDTATAERKRATDERAATAADRARTADERLGAANTRDLTAQARDLAAIERDRAAAALEAVGEGAGAVADAARRLAAVRARAAHDRARAAADRASAAADRAAAAEDRAQAAIEIRHSYHDDLTGALRREMGEVALQHELDRARRNHSPLVLAFVDVDRLKAINDRDGHGAGDALLKAVVTTMRAKLRSFDPVVRFGGDEFVCALQGTEPADATARFAEIKAALARDNEEAGISVGVVELQDGETLDELIARGDAALYAAKGRARR